MAVVGLRVAPTKGFLLELKRRIAIIKDGYKLLSTKRDELTSKINAFLEELKAIKRAVIEQAEKIVLRFRECYAILGPDIIKSYANVNKGLFEAEVLPLSIMGILVPRVKVLKSPEVKDKFGPIIREIIYDACKVLRNLIKVTELEMKIEIIAHDLEKTNRIVNALEKIIIPDLEQLAKFIEDLIEEESLEEFTRVKLVRNIIVKRRGE